MLNTGTTRAPLAESHPSQQETQETGVSAGADGEKAMLVKPKEVVPEMDRWGLLRCKGNSHEVVLQHRMKNDLRDTYSIGRSSKCDIVCVGPFVSTHHCVVYCDYTQPKLRVFLEDCSANGTFVNDALTRLRKGERMELKSGDEVFLINPRKVGAESVAAFVFINLRERLGQCREIEAVRAGGGAGAMGMNVGGPGSSHRAPHIEDQYVIGDQIGSGMSGQVYRCVHKGTQLQCAVKIVDTRRFALTPGLSSADLLEEARLMQQCEHPNIIKVLDTFQTESLIYIVMELLRGGDLFDRIVEKERYCEENARKLMAQVLSAVAYLHDRDIVHRDLKPENILLFSNQNDFDVKVTDFGLAKKASRDGLKTFCGTPQYFAPEVLKRKQSGKDVGAAGRYGAGADIWSLGVILYILLSGSFPFSDDSEILRADYSLSGIEWEGVSVGAKHLICSLMTLRADQRLTAAQALRHPWVLGVEYVAPGLARIRRATAAPVPAASAVAVAVLDVSAAVSTKAGGITPAAALAEGKKQTANKSRQRSVGGTAGAVLAGAVETVGAGTKGVGAAMGAGVGAGGRRRSQLRRGASSYAPLELITKHRSYSLEHDPAPMSAPEPAPVLAPVPMPATALPRVQTGSRATPPGQGRFEQYQQYPGQQEPRYPSYMSYDPTVASELSKITLKTPSSSTTAFAVVAVAAGVTGSVFSDSSSFISLHALHLSVCKDVSCMEPRRTRREVAPIASAAGVVERTASEEKVEASIPSMLKLQRSNTTNESAMKATPGTGHKDIGIAYGGDAMSSDEIENYSSNDEDQTGRTGARGGRETTVPPPSTTTSVDVEEPLRSKRKHGKSRNGLALAVPAAPFAPSTEMGERGLGSAYADQSLCQSARAMSISPQRQDLGLGPPPTRSVRRCVSFGQYVTAADGAHADVGDADAAQGESSAPPAPTSSSTSPPSDPPPITSSKGNGALRPPQKQTSLLQSWHVALSAKAPVHTDRSTRSSTRGLGGCEDSGDKENSAKVPAKATLAPSLPHMQDADADSSASMSTSVTGAGAAPAEGVALGQELTRVPMRSLSDLFSAQSRKAQSGK